VGLEGARQQRDAGRGQHAHGVAVGARGEQAGHHGGLEERAGAPRVAPDHETSALAVGALRRQRGDELTADAVGKVGRERRLVRNAADAIGSEQALAQARLGLAIS